MEEVKEEIRTTQRFVMLEALDNMPIDCNKKYLYPHDGTFLLTRVDGMMSVVTIERGDYESEYCQNYQEAFIGNKQTIDAEFVMDSRDVDEKMDAMTKRYDEDVKRRKNELEQEHEKRRMELEHQHEIRMMELENEMPKRFEQGEWISGKTLTDIIKTIVGKDSKTSN